MSLAYSFHLETLKGDFYPDISDAGDIVRYFPLYLDSSNSTERIFSWNNSSLNEISMATGIARKNLINLYLIKLKETLNGKSPYHLISATPTSVRIQLVPSNVGNVGNNIPNLATRYVMSEIHKTRRRSRSKSRRQKKSRKSDKNSARRQRK